MMIRVLIALFFAGSVWAEPSVHILRQEFGAGPVTQITLDNPSGDVRVRAAPGQIRSRFLMVCQFKSAVERIPAQLHPDDQGKRLKVYPHDDLMRCDITAIVPETQAVAVITKQGRISVKGLKAALSISAEDQPMQIETWAPVRISTKAGAVDLMIRNPVPQVAVETRTGNIRLELPDALDGRISITTAGDVTTDTAALASALTRNRNHRVAELGAKAGEIIIDSDAGDVTLLADTSRHPHRMREKW